MQRIHLLLIIFYLWFLAIAIRLFYWQVIVSADLKDQALRQHIVRDEIVAERGEILASDGSPLVTNKLAYLVYAEPKRLTDKDATADKLAELLKIDQASISALLTKDLLWIPIKHKVDSQTVEELKKLNLAGIGFQKEAQRFYPEGSMSAHLLGFVGSAYDGSPRGYFGLEGYYERELRGRPGFIQQAVSAAGNPILAAEAKRVIPENGRSLKLHLDKTVQFISEKKLLKAIEKYGAQGGNVVILNPDNGGVIAMAAFPSYDPASFENFPEAYFKNPIVSQSYEPGSTFKVIVMAAAIDAGLVKPDTIFDESGPILISGHRIRTWNNKYAGKITATQILERSSNVGMVQVARKLGKKKLLKYIRSFGFGEETNIDLFEEASPSLRPDDSWREIDLATVSFGQGIAVTPIQMVRALTVIASGGNLFEPQVVDSIITPAGEVIDIKPRIVRRVISKATATIVKEMMVKAVDNGEARFAKPKGYRIAGKTGTAQIPVAGHYDTEKTIASFFGFAPADNPKFVMLVTLREPTASPWGSETAAPLFFDIATELLSYYGVTPSE